MSLINDALKKAQKQRTGDSPSLASMPSIGGDPAAKIAQRATPGGFNSLLVRGGLIAAALVVILIGGYFGLRQSPPPAATPPVAPPVATAKETPKPVATEEQAPLNNLTAPAITFNLAIPAEKVPATPAPPAEAHPVATVTAAPETKPTVDVAASSPKPAPPVAAPVAAPVPVAAAPVAAAKIEPRAITFIESLRIAGIRASATDSKVLMNDRVYRAGDIVEHDIGLKLIGITANSLTFEDEHGGRYTRNF